MNFKGFKQIVIGLVFLFLNFNINGFDIIPDFVGYIFIWVGLASLSEYHQEFRKAKIFAIILFFLSLIWLFLGPSSYNSSDDGMLFVWLLSLISLVYAIYLRLKIGKGMTDLLKRYRLTDAAGKTVNCINLNIVVLVLTGVLTFPPLQPLAEFPLITFPLIIAGIAAGIWLMVRITRNRQLLETHYDSASKLD